MFPIVSSDDGRRRHKRHGVWRPSLSLLSIRVLVWHWSSHRLRSVEPESPTLVSYIRKLNPLGAQLVEMFSHGLLFSVFCSPIFPADTVFVSHLLIVKRETPSLSVASGMIDEAYARLWVPEHRMLYVDYSLYKKEVCLQYLTWLLSWPFQHNWELFWLNGCCRTSTPASFPISNYPSALVTLTPRSSTTSDQRFHPSKVKTTRIKPKVNNDWCPSSEQQVACPHEIGRAN